MSKAQKGNKESKKAPMSSFKEKRTAKHLKKDAENAVPQPFLPRH